MKLLFSISVFFLSLLITPKSYAACNEDLPNPSQLDKTSSQSMKKGEFVHIVFFWLKNPNDEKERAQFETSLKTFIKNSKHIKTMHLGFAANTNRTVIDNTYTYCMVLTFTSKEEQDKYQDEAGHKTFIAESENLWKKVIVYDSENFL